MNRSLLDALLSQCREAKNHGTAKLLQEGESIGDSGRQAGHHLVAKCHYRLMFVSVV